MTPTPELPMPNCPTCGGDPVPEMLPYTGDVQRFCSNMQCAVLMWNPSLPDGGMSTPSMVDVSDLADGPGWQRGDLP